MGARHRQIQNRARTVRKYAALRTCALLALVVPLLAVARSQADPVPVPLTEADRALLDYDGPEEPWPESTASSTSTLGTGSVRAQQLDVAEAVLRHVANHNESSVGQNASAYCAELFGARAPRELIRRFAGTVPPMESGCDATGSRIVLSVSSVRLLDANHAEATGGYYEGSLSASGHDYWLLRTADGWVVVGDELGFIS